MEKVFKIYIRTTPRRLWAAITAPDTGVTRDLGTRVTSDWTPGSHFELSDPGTGTRLGIGVNLEVSPPRRLVQRTVALWSADVRDAGVTRVTWDIETVGDSCRLTVVHDQIRDSADCDLYRGWPATLSSLKSHLEAYRSWAVLPASGR
ncbi:SRPBCC domain-containing protein [Frankia tisae]|uniref:SRPBCC domain-containing protein n=1 Tax=Frankia tisae TaxID=2950104 RepID=UPI0021C0B1C4|nr:SRPBCC domain-containing protein [Frankia tisae]